MKRIYMEIEEAYNRSIFSGYESNPIGIIEWYCPKELGFNFELECDGKSSNFCYNCWYMSVSESRSCSNK